MTGLAPSLWLLDDIDAELDKGTADRLWRLFGEPEAQLLIARLSPESGGVVDGSTMPDTMFHVNMVFSSLRSPILRRRRNRQFDGITVHAYAVRRV